MAINQVIRSFVRRVAVCFVVIAASPSNVEAGFVSVVGDPGDGGVDVNGVAVNLSNPDFRPGTGGDIVRGQAAIYFFELPALPLGSTISNVELQFQYLGIYVDRFFSIPEFKLDLFGINARATANIVGSDYHDGAAALSGHTLIQSSIVSQTTVAGNISVANSTLLGFIQSLYNSDGSPIAAYAVFRLNPDAELPPNSGLRRGYLVATADHPEESYRPVLSLTTVAPVPEPASVVMWGLSAIGIAIGAHRRTKTKRRHSLPG